MVVVSSAVGSKELAPLIRAVGVPCDVAPLAFGDVAFTGNGPDGEISIGIERKTLHDMLSCIEDSRYASHQRLGMKSMYDVSVLIIEGFWKPREDGVLMESKDSIHYWPCRPHGLTVMYSKLRRYLISIRYTGVSVMITRNMAHTAYDICEEYHYHQKKWDKHTSLKEIQKLAIPQLSGKPSLARKWANDIDGVGVVLGEQADMHFRRKAIRLATSDEEDWIACGAGVGKARSIIRQINGWN